jgi:hypothetical protein
VDSGLLKGTSKPPPLLQLFHGSPGPLGQPPACTLDGHTDQLPSAWGRDLSSVKADEEGFEGRGGGHCRCKPHSLPMWRGFSARHQPQNDSTLIIRSSGGPNSGLPAPQNQPLHTEHSGLASLCSGDRKYPCGPGGRAWHRVSSDKQWPSGQLTLSFHSLPFGVSAGGVSCRCLMEDQAAATKGSPPFTLVGFPALVSRGASTLSPHTDLGF